MCILYELYKKSHQKPIIAANHGFHPTHAPYYVVLPFDNKKEIEFKKQPQLRQRINTYRAKIRPLSDFIGIK